MPLVLLLEAMPIAEGVAITPNGVLRRIIIKVFKRMIRNGDDIALDVTQEGALIKCPSVGYEFI